MKVNNKIYTGKHIADGFFDSMINLKTIKPETKEKLRQISGRHQAISSIRRDKVLDTILTNNPQEASKALRSHKSTVSAKISELKVNDKIYTGKNIADGFFDSMSNLKTMKPETKNCSECESFKFDYKLVREISKAGDKIPPISLHRAESLLHSLKPTVCDHFNISALHYIHAGPVGIQQFQFLVNSAIENIENTTCEELNDAHACILYKGHLKDKTLAGSYRTISTCPFVAKAIDYYIRELSHSEWTEAQADTQFLGANMSHELGALLITETISHSLSDLNLPVFCLFLDARSAFDLTVRELFVRKLHLLGTSGHRLVYIDNRLKNRKTFLEWDKSVLGPIQDELGFEQGGISSGEFYICYNNEQIQTAQDSGLGVSVGPVDVAAVGQADDVVLLSNDVHYLNFLLQLTIDYCKKYHVTLAPEKTKLVAFFKKSHKQLVKFQELISPITIDETPIKFSSTAEHVGVIRSNDGNLPHLQGRVTAHIKALYSVLPAGLARKHSANVAAALRVESLYALPVLLSGVAPLTLSKAEISVLHSHHKKSLLNLQKLPRNTPESVVMFLAGSLGATAHIHIRQLGLFGMITRLPENILHSIALNKISSEPDSSSSWFVQIRHLCTQYCLPSPLSLLLDPPTKCAFKSLVKSSVTDFWKQKYEDEASPKPSLQFFKPKFMFLNKPHPLWLSSKSNPFETNKSRAVSKLLSGRYPTEAL